MLARNADEFVNFAPYENAQKVMFKGVRRAYDALRNGLIELLLFACLFVEGL